MHVVRIRHDMRKFQIRKLTIVFQDNWVAVALMPMHVPE